MLTLSIVLIFIISVLMILIVLAQNSKGGGLSSTFGGGGGQMGGVVQTNKFLEKTTWTLAIALIVFSITASLSIDRPKENPESKIQKELMELNQTNIPNIPTQQQVDEFRKKEDKKNNATQPDK